MSPFQVLHTIFFQLFKAQKSEYYPIEMLFLMWWPKTFVVHPSKIVPICKTKFHDVGKQDLMKNKTSYLKITKDIKWPLKRVDGCRKAHVSSAIFFKKFSLKLRVWKLKIESQTVIGYKLLNAAKIHCNNIQTHLQSRWTHMTQI